MSALDVFLSVRGVLGVSVSIDSPSKYSGNFLYLGKLETQIFDLCFFEMGLLLIALAPIASILYKAGGSYLLLPKQLDCLSFTGVQIRLRRDSLWYI